MPSESSANYSITKTFSKTVIKDVELFYAKNDYKLQLKLKIKMGEVCIEVKYEKTM